MEMTKEILIFESMDEILWCDHSNKTSSAELSHGIIHILGFCKNEIWDSSWILILSILGSERVKITIEANKKVVNCLDVTLNLSSGKSDFMRFTRFT